MESRIEHSIIKAGIEDIDEIIDIRRNCFPYSFEAHSPRFVLRNKWLIKLRSDAIEIYMLKINNNTAGFYELVVDIPLFERMQNEAILSYFLSYTYVAVFHPKCIIPTIKKLIRETKYINPNDQSNKTEINIDKQIIAWEESIGVHSKYRGIGLSKIMKKHLLNRCVMLGKDVVKCVVDPNNIPSMNLHKSFGYIITGENKYGCVLKRELNK